MSVSASSATSASISAIVEGSERCVAGDVTLRIARVPLFSELEHAHREQDHIGPQLVDQRRQ